MSFNLKLSRGVDLRALDLIADRWSIWILLALDERDGTRFSDLASAPGLSRRVLSDRLVRLTAAGLVSSRHYSTRPLRRLYFVSPRGAALRNLSIQAMHVASGRGIVRADVDADPLDQLIAGDLERARDMFERAIQPLVAYDERYQTSLVETLEVWLGCDGSTSVAAARLYAHRHTVRYRLDRVGELTGFDVNLLADREHLQLGLRAMRILRRVADASTEGGQ